MSRFLSSLFMVPIVLAWAAPATAQLDFCGYKSNNTAKYTDGNKIVDWGSVIDADGNDPNRWNISNYVINVEGKGARDIDWPPALLRVYNLQAGHYIFHCLDAVIGRSERSGPLFFGRDRLSAATTTVFASTQPPATEPTLKVGSPLDISSQVIVTAKGAKNRAIHVRVTTRVVRTAKNYEITYSIENLSDAEALVDLPIPEARVKLGGEPLRVRKGLAQSVTITTDRFPQMLRLPVQVSEAKGETTAIVNMPTAQPQRPRG